jgi:hypothetical protein
MEAGLMGQRRECQAGSWGGENAHPGYEIEIEIETVTESEMETCGVCETPASCGVCAVVWMPQTVRGMEKER